MVIMKKEVREASKPADRRTSTARRKETRCAAKGALQPIMFAGIQENAENTSTAQR